MRGRHQANDQQAQPVLLHHAGRLDAWLRLPILTDTREKGFTALE